MLQSRILCRWYSWRNEEFFNREILRLNRREFVLNVKDLKHTAPCNYEIQKRRTLIFLGKFWFGAGEC